MVGFAFRMYKTTITFQQGIAKLAGTYFVQGLLGLFRKIWWWVTPNLDKTSYPLFENCRFCQKVLKCQKLSKMVNKSWDPSLIINLLIALIDENEDTRPISKPNWDHGSRGTFHQIH